MNGLRRGRDEGVRMLPEDREPMDVSAGSMPLGGTAETTGRWVVTFADDEDVDPATILRSAGVSNVASSLEFAEQALDVAQEFKLLLWLNRGHGLPLQ